MDWLFMLGLPSIGLALLIGIEVTIAGYSGVVLMLLLWLSRLPPENNPILKEHIVYLLVQIGLARVNAGHWIGLGKPWPRRIMSLRAELSPRKEGLR